MVNVIVTHWSPTIKTSSHPSDANEPMTDFGLIHKTIFILCRGYMHYELFTEHFEAEFFLLAPFPTPQ